ncbi:MAG: D-alanyl-D-alanine carboxypeptidase, partial [Muribaculaceae bacterium]|nr:D-alanyl-D-alanine carboxypeptidase [Muribaculaceae bacterium]
MIGVAVAFGNCPLSLKGGDAASVGIYIAPIEAGRTPTVSYQPERLMTPASVMKSVTVAAALNCLGGSHRWETRVLAVGKIENGTLNGNIIIEGSGDPTLGSTYFRKEQPDFLRLVSESAARYGIRQIDGKVIRAAAWPDQG